MTLQPFDVEHNDAQFPQKGNPAVIARGPLVFTAAELAHALFATGRAPWDHASHGWTSVWEWLHRTSVIPSYFRQENHGELVMSDLGLELDRSERSALSYALGQAMANLFSSNQLGVPFLMHLDRYGTRHQVKFGPTGMRPDMIGWRPRTHSIGGVDWVVVEAKGRLLRARPSLRQHVLNQIQAVRTLGKPAQQPLWSYGTVSYFSYASPHRLGRRNLCLEVITPSSTTPVPPAGSAETPDDWFGFPGDREEYGATYDERTREYWSRRADDASREPSHLTVNLDLFVSAYYEPFLAAIEHGEEVASPQEDIRIAAYPELGLRVGMLRSIASRISHAREQGTPAGLSEPIMGSLFGSWELPAGVFADGTIIQTPWDNDPVPDSNRP